MVQDDVAGKNAKIRKHLKKKDLPEIFGAPLPLLCRTNSLQTLREGDRLGPNKVLYVPSSLGGALGGLFFFLAPQHSSISRISSSCYDLENEAKVKACYVVKGIVNWDNLMYELQA